MSTIKINPKNKGKFNALKKRTGKTTEQLTHSQNSLTRKRAVFAQNAKKWKHEDGGLVEYGLGGTLSSAGGALGMIPTPYTQVAGAALGIIGGLVGSAEEQKAAQEQQRMQMAQASGNMQAGIVNNYTPTFATGGITPDEPTKPDYTGMGIGFMQNPNANDVVQNPIRQEKWKAGLKQELRDNLPFISNMVGMTGPMRAVNTITKEIRALRNTNVKKELIDEMDDAHYYLMHQTDRRNATGIAKEGFRVGSGFKGTTLHAGKESLGKAIDDVATGHGHKGASNIVIMKFPKKDFPYYRQQGEDSFSDIFMDKGLSNVPNEFLHGIYALGGLIPNSQPNIEVEGGEQMQGPGGITPDEPTKPDYTGMGIDYLRNNPMYSAPTLPNIEVRPKPTIWDKVAEENKNMGPLAAMTYGPAMIALGLPQLWATEKFTGKYERPSEALGVKNPLLGMATDMVLDPVNLVGVGAGATAKKLSKVPGIGVDAPEKGYHALNLDHWALHPEKAYGEYQLPDQIALLAAAAGNRLMPLLKHSKTVKRIAENIMSQSSNPTREVGDIYAGIAKEFPSVRVLENPPKTIDKALSKLTGDIKGVDTPYENFKRYLTDTYNKYYSKDPNFKYWQPDEYIGYVNSENNGPNLIKQYLYGNEPGLKKLNPDDLATADFSRYNGRVKNPDYFEMISDIKNGQFISKDIIDRDVILNTGKNTLKHDGGTIQPQANVAGYVETIVKHPKTGARTFVAQDYWKFFADDYKKNWVRWDQRDNYGRLLAEKQSGIIDKVGKPFFLIQNNPIVPRSSVKPLEKRRLDVVDDFLSGKLTRLEYEKELSRRKFSKLSKEDPKLLVAKRVRDRRFEEFGEAEGPDIPYDDGIYSQGGVVPNTQPNIEVEGGEQLQGPDGSMAGISSNAPSHAQGGVDVAAQPGTRIFSDKLKASTGRTFAEEADKIRKQLAKYDKLLN